MTMNEMGARAKTAARALANAGALKESALLHAAGALWQRREEDSLTGLFLRETEQLCAKRPDDPVCRLAARFGLAALENGEDICP